MGISSIEYRAHIGSFYNNLVRIQTKIRKYSPTNKVYSARIIILSLLVLVPISIYSRTYIEQTDAAVSLSEQAQKSLAVASVKSVMLSSVEESDNYGNCVLTTFFFK